MSKATTSITPIPKHSMLKGSVVSWRCEMLSLRTASLRSLSGTPTLNSGGAGVTPRARCTSDAHMRALRTFVRQQSSNTGPASIVILIAACVLDIVKDMCAETSQANGRHMRAHVVFCPLGVVSCHLSDHTWLNRTKCRPEKVRVLSAMRRQCPHIRLKTNMQALCTRENITKLD